MRAQSLLALICSLAAASLFAGETLRFSQSLTPEQRTGAGLDQLNSDQIAALDALVRLDALQTAAAAKKAAAAAKNAAATAPVESTIASEPARTAFSQSLSVDQRRAAGLDTLSADQRTAVDALVAQRVASSNINYEPATSSVQAVEFFPNRFEVHGEVGFSFGAGSGGYSSREAWMTTSLLDTKTGTEISVGVASGREKWKGPYRYYRGYRNDWDEVSFGLSAPLFRSH